MKDCLFNRVLDRAIFCSDVGTENIFIEASGVKEWNKLDKAKQDKVLALLVRRKYEASNDG